MPIRAENRARYPADWNAISRRVREDAGNRCEGSPQFPDCRAMNGKPHPVTGSRVVLTVAHLDHQPENCARSNLRAWCQRCHNAYDAPMRRAGIAQREKSKMANGDLFDRGVADGRRLTTEEAGRVSDAINAAQAALGEGGTG